MMWYGAATVSSGWHLPWFKTGTHHRLIYPLALLVVSGLALPMVACILHCHLYMPTLPATPIADQSLFVCHLDSGTATDMPALPAPDVLRATYEMTVLPILVSAVLTLTWLHWFRWACLLAPQHCDHPDCPPPRLCSVRNMLEGAGYNRYTVIKEDICNYKNRCSIV